MTAFSERTVVHRAITHVASRSSAGPLDLKRVWHYVARFGSPG